MEKVIDPKLKLIINSPDYKVIPGDRFLIEYSERVEVLFVDSSYTITSNAFKSINVKGMTVSNLRTTITQQLKIHLGATITYKFDMIDYGVFNVLIRGEVLKSDFIAGSGLDRLDYYVSKSPLTDYSSLKKIKIIRNKKELYFNLFNYHRYGNLDQNPIIQPGDIIEIQKKYKEISISGAVKRPGKYELLNDENLEDLIEFANGLTEEAYPQLTRFSRFNPIKKEYTSEYIDLTKKRDIELKHMDEIHIYDISIIQPVAFIEGIFDTVHKNQMESQDLALLDPKTPEEEKFISIRIKRGDRLLDVLQYIKLSEDISDIKNAYIIRSIGEENVFKLDLFDLLYKNDLSKNIEIKNQDRIVIPSKDNKIAVLGMVSAPQLVPFEMNRSAMYYIKQAGGVIPISGNNNIFWLVRKGTARPRSYVMAKADTIILNEGDRIEIKPSGLHWVNSIFPTINSFLGLTVSSTNLVIGITTFYDQQSK